jgi:hypothetical protein
MTTAGAERRLVQFTWDEPEARAILGFLLIGFMAAGGGERAATALQGTLTDVSNRAIRDASALLLGPDANAWAASMAASATVARSVMRQLVEWLDLEGHGDASRAG